MRLAVIADVHGNLPALEVVLEDMATRSVDLVVNCGDCVTAPLWPKETFAALRELNAPTVRGNHDRWLGEPGPDDRSRIIAFTRAEIGEHAARELHGLPATLEVAPGVLAVHGTPSSDTAYLLEESVDHRLRLVSPAVLEERLGPTDFSLILCGAQSHPACRVDTRRPTGPQPRERRNAALCRQHRRGAQRGRELARALRDRDAPRHAVERRVHGAGV